MKELKKNIAAVETYRTADTTNREGFAAWTPSDAEQLEQLAMTGTLGHSFYASAREQTAAALELLERAEPEALAKAIVRGRQEGFVRAFPILGLVKLSVKSPELFQNVFEQVILTGNDLGDFLDLVRSVRGLGRGVKRAIHNWLDRKLTPYYAMKYRASIADAIRLSRYRGEDPLCAFVLAAYSNVKGGSEEKLRAAEEKYPVLKARSEFIAALESGDTATAAKLLRDYGLDTDSLTAFNDRFDCEVWSAAAATTPVMKFLKYLAKYAREGVAVDRLAAEKLTVEALRRAKVFPFRLYTAATALEQISALQLASEGVKKATLPPWQPQTVGDALPGEVMASPAPETPAVEIPKPETPMQIYGRVERVRARLLQLLDEYATKYDWADFNRFSWVIAPDVSGSMSSRIANSTLTFAELSAMFVGFFMKGLNNVRVLPWNTGVKRYDVPASAPVAEHMRTIRNMVYGGTYMEAPVLYMIANRIKVDFAVFLTDTEEYGRGWLVEWKRYRELFPNAQAFLLRADSYQSAPISEEDAAKYGVWQIFGWNDSVIEYMRNILGRRQA